jgi:menaquinone-9 beta-reductase
VRTVRILGGGPAGSCAALAAQREGADVEVFDRSRFPKHKVCGEFISPEIAPVLDQLGVLPRFLEARPFSVRRMALHFGHKTKAAPLPEPAYGLSRYTFDYLLQQDNSAADLAKPDIIATGRPGGTARGARLFGFKAHYDGPPDDAVELFFLSRAYVGINCVEGRRTNVCGLAPEHVLKLHNFQPDSLMNTSAALKERLRPMTRNMNWLFTGPLEYAQQWNRDDAYLAGDALSFVDPFTGSGLLCAAITGALAGKHAARGVPVHDHIRACRESIARPFFFSSALRRMAGTDWAEHLVTFVPARFLFRLTRPR